VEIVILSLPRSGSSMVTAIFRKHGISIGCKGYENEFGYQTHENTKIRRAVNEITHVSGLPPVKKFKSNFGAEHIRKIFRSMPNNWVYKVGPQDHDVLKAAFPDAKFVCVKRDIENTTMSQHKKRGGNVDSLREHNVLVMEQMKSFGYPFVDSDAVIAGDYSTLESAFDYCGLNFDPRIADQCIDKGKWHYASDMRQVGK